MSDIYRPGRMCPIPLKSWEGHVSPPSAYPRWHVINSEMSDIGRVTCAPFSNYGRGTCAPPPPLLAFNTFRDGSQAGPPGPLLKSKEGHVSSLLTDHRWQRCLTLAGSPISHLCTWWLIDWLINASRTGSRRPGVLEVWKGAPGRVYR